MPKDSLVRASFKKEARNKEEQLHTKGIGQVLNGRRKEMT